MIMQNLYNYQTSNMNVEDLNNQNNIEETKLSEPFEEKPEMKNNFETFERLNENDLGKRKSFEYDFEDVIILIEYKRREEKII